MRNNIFPLIFMIGISFMPIISIHFPRGLSFAPLLFGLIMCAWWVFIKKENLTHSKPYMFCILGICTLCIISTLWSIEPMDAYKKALKSSAIMIFSIPLFNLAKSIRVEILKPYLWLFPAGVTVAALLCSVELALDLPIYRMIRGIDTNLSTAVMNRGVVSVIFAFFVSMLFINHIDNKKIKVALNIAINISVIVMLLLTQSQSGQLAYILGVLTFLLPHKYRITQYLIAFTVIAAMITTPWIVTMLFDILKENAQELPWLKDAYAGNRVEIWDFVMNYALNNPLYGYGMEATRFVTNFEHDYIYHKGPTILHPHNFAVQIWMEFGVIGVIMASILTYFTMHKISKLELSSKRISTAIVIAVLCVLSVGYGMWQSWWIGELCFIAALCSLLITKARE